MVLFQDLPVVSGENMKNVSVADVPADIWIEWNRGEGRGGGLSEWVSEH